MPDVQGNGQGDEVSVDAIIDGTWDALRGNYFRRAMLGKVRCAEIVMHTLAVFPDRQIVALKATKGSAVEQQVIESTIVAVAERYQMTSAAKQQSPYGFVLLSLVLYWAIAAIVQHLIVEWWKRHFDAAALRQEYGWK